MEGFDEIPDILEPGSSREVSYLDDEGSDGVEINHNPKICILSKDIWEKINYQQDLKKMLNKVKLNLLISPKGPGSKDQESLVYHSFGKHVKMFVYYLWIHYQGN